ncbi:DUF5133 domain-containing protein [Streptomyces sp. NPDC046557]|uniref:DUF5133 domain-containing protein n=1 Tax=Streptomyces sp. NPDC046557 TaxID=3155372 RepID=UPI0033F2ABF2
MTRPEEAAAAVVGSATGVLMAFVPCGHDTARRILPDTARRAGVGPTVAAHAVMALRGDGEGPGPGGRRRWERVLRSLIDDTLSAPAPLSDCAGPGLLPDLAVLRRRLHHFRALRRRTFAAPNDAVLRCRLEDASYTLCVLMGRRSTHLALRAAEELLTADRLDRPHRSQTPYR